jgi:hypothetical protein
MYVFISEKKKKFVIFKENKNLAASEYTLEVTTNTIIIKR